MSGEPSWALLQRSLFRLVLHTNDSSARTQYHCTGQEFLLRTKRSQALLRAVLTGTVADRVRSVVVPACVIFGLEAALLALLERSSSRMNNSPICCSEVRVLESRPRSSGGDVMTAMAAFPLANWVTLISQEPLMPTPPRKIERRSLTAPLPPAALAQLSAIFACNRAGGYFFGLQVRE